VKLKRLEITSLPGIDERFSLEDLGDGFHVVVGPNGIGKSSLCRATRALLWSELGASSRVWVRASFERAGETWLAERQGRRHRWQRNGEDSEPPPLPPAHLEGCFFLVLRDLLDPSGGDGPDVAGQIRRQMSGGFDLDAAGDAVFGAVKPRHGRKEEAELVRARRAVEDAARDHEELARREAGLEELDREIGAAEEAERRSRHLGDAVDLARRRLALAPVVHQLAQLPACPEQMTGSEAREIAEKEGELRDLGDQREALERELRAAREQQRSSGLDATIAPEELRAWQARARALARLEADLESDREALATARGRLGEACRVFGAEADAAPDLSLDDDADLFAYLREASEARLRQQVADERLRTLGAPEPGEEELRRTRQLHEAVLALRAWLRAPDPGAAETRWLTPARLAVAGALLCAGAALWTFVSGAAPLAALAFGLGVGLGTAAWALRRRPGGGDARAAAQREFARQSIEAPQAWEVAEVDLRLRDLEGELHELLTSQQRAERRRVDRSHIEAERAGALEKLADLEERGRRLRERLGLAGLRPDAELVDAARALDQLRRARESERAAAARLAEREQRRAEALQRIAGFLDAYGTAPPDDAAAAEAASSALAERSASLREALEKRARAQDGLERIDRKLAKLRDDVTGLFARAGVEPGDRAGLARRLEDLERRRALESRRQPLAAQLEMAEQRLADAGEAGLAERDEASLEAERHKLAAQAGALKELRERQARIREQVRRAREGRDLEDALAARDAAREALGERRAQALQAQAGRFLLSRVRERHEQTQRPRVLERARQLFLGFTHHAYELQVSARAGGGLRARNTATDQGQGLEELSDGTRAQLLLAARLAFAEEVERGERLPLFLDEALDQSDPSRFRAIAQALARVVRDEGRQVFYLTSDPVDVERIDAALRSEGCEAARRIDLAEVRGRASGVSDPGALEVPRAAGVPPAAGRTPEEYGVQVRARPLDPRRGHRAQHLLHLAWDDLPLLERLLRERIQLVGQWLVLETEGAALRGRLTQGSAVGSQLAARSQLLEQFCVAWRVGRGRPVDREALERSGAVSETFIDRVSEVAHELGGDARKLLDALAERSDERLAGYRRTRVGELERFLEEEGHLDPQPELDERALMARALAHPAAAELPEGVAAECLRRWWWLAGRGG
jgi:uncharacterized protein YhaN